MKPRIIERLDGHEDSLEATVKRIIQENWGLAGKQENSLLIGTIIPFSGDMEGAHPINPLTRTVDRGYALCDGTSCFSEALGGMVETPDLRDRFIMGGGGQFLAGQRGGDFESAHTVDISPTTLTVNQIPSHQHMIGHSSILSGTNARVVSLGDTTIRLDTRYSQTLYTGGGQPHTHSGRFTLSGDDKIPPYHALCYLMKI